MTVAPCSAVVEGTALRSSRRESQNAQMLPCGPNSTRPLRASSRVSRPRRRHARSAQRQTTLGVYGIYTVDQIAPDYKHDGVPKKTANPLLRRVGARLRRARQAKGVSQEAVALAAGLDRSYVSGLERGEFNVSLLVLARLARAAGTRLSALLESE
jgi:ribosome-binding protein aMBF1 (putative translation factor)